MQLLQEQRYLSDFKYAFVIQMGAGGTLRAKAQFSTVGIIQMMCKWQCSGKGWVQGGMDKQVRNRENVQEKRRNLRLKLFSNN